MNLLDLAATGGQGALRTSTGIQVDLPWGQLNLASLELSAGWYELKSAAPVCLQFYEPSAFRLIELSIAPDTPAYIRLAGGIYQPRILCGIRPGHYPLQNLILQKLSLPSFVRLLARRLLRDLRRKSSLKSIASRIKQVLKGGGTFGVQTITNPLFVSGPLMRADQQCPHNITSLSKLKIFVCLRDRSYLLPDSIGLEAQTYPHWHTNPDLPYDIQLTLDREQNLQPDALALIANHFEHHPAMDILITDIWLNGAATTRVAFDPLLYSEALPAPYAQRRNVETHIPWTEQQSRYGILSIPIATSVVDEAPPKPIHIPIKNALASIIIPTRDRADLLHSCLDGLFENTSWPHEVIIIDNGSVEPETHDLFKTFLSKGGRVIQSNTPFNFAALCNLGATEARGKYLVFMNNDIILTHPDWLGQMIALASLPDIGAVGAKLIYPDGRLQHGGVALGLTQICGHMWRNLPQDGQTKLPSLMRNSLRTAITGALMCIDREKFDSIDGFDETAFPVTLNDIDLCLRLRAKGWFSAFAAHAIAVHLEKESRGDDTNPVKVARRLKEMQNFQERWQSPLDDSWLPMAYSRSSESLSFR